MSEADASEVRSAVEEFISSFDQLDWERFRQCFASCATVFFPFDTEPRRADGKAELEAGFKRFFDNVRNNSLGPPYLHIEPQDAAIQLWNDIALVTFHLDRPNGTGRRTLVLKRYEERWRIVHLHASTINVRNT